MSITHLNEWRDRETEMKRVFACHCGCTSMELNEDGTIECADCGIIMANRSHVDPTDAS